VASHGTVTDVLGVPSDTVSAHLEHAFAVAAEGGPEPTGAKVGVVGDAPTVEAVFRELERHESAPFVLDLTLSGPSGEDIIGSRGLEALVERLGMPDLVAVRRTDAELVAGMEIPSLDDAQVAVQRIAQRGARRVLLRCGRIATHYFDQDAEPPPYAVDLYYDGDEFALFEAPFLSGLKGVHGASSALLMSMLRDLVAGAPIADAIQAAKAYATEALRACEQYDNPVAPRYVLDAPSASAPRA
jgi:hydroxymethylpyrimidine/phosphomethylpyrimidine kinase